MFLETKNGDEFATLKVKMQASLVSPTLGKTVHGSSAKRKSPSAFRRDRERMEKFVMEKRLQETRHPEKTSTPSMKLQLQERNTPSLDKNKTGSVSETPKEPLIDKPETLETRQEDEKHEECENNLEDHETIANESPTMSDAEVSDVIKKSLAPMFDCMDDVQKKMNEVKNLIKNDGLDTETKDRNVEHDDDDDNISAAKIWAQQQKQSCLK